VLKLVFHRQSKWVSALLQQPALDDGIQGNCLNGKWAASLPPGTPHSKAREEQQHWKSRRVAENHVVDWNEDVFAT
jgi:hypothetical protein